MWNLTAVSVSTIFEDGTDNARHKKNTMRQDLQTARVISEVPRPD